MKYSSFYKHLILVTVVSFAAQPLMVATGASVAPVAAVTPAVQSASSEGILSQLSSVIIAAVTKPFVLAGTVVVSQFIKEGKNLTKMPVITCLLLYSGYRGIKSLKNYCHYLWYGKTDKTTTQTTIERVRSSSPPPAYNV